MAKLNGDQPPTFHKNIPTARMGTHYMTFSENWSTAYVSERPGRAYPVIDMATQEETANVWVGGYGDEWESDYSDDYTRAGPDMAVYIWFKHGRAQMHHERGGD